MNLYHISQSKNNEWDTYSDAVVCAKSAMRAKLIHPNGTPSPYDDYNWTNPENVEVKFIGKAKKGIKENTVICVSFHAG